jgi:hypothetical protein
MTSSAPIERTSSAWLEPGHLLADRLDAAGEVHAPNGDLGSAQPHGWYQEADEVGQAGHDVPDAPVQPGRMDPHQHLVVGGRRLVDVPELQDVGGAVGVLHDGLHSEFPRSTGLGRDGHLPPSCLATC